MTTLVEASIACLLQHQDASGAFLACPNFPTYRYSWLRDGAFCAYALDQAGQSAAAGRFHAWVFGILRRYADKLSRGAATGPNQAAPTAGECLHSRFTVDGLEVPGNWGHHQLDGLGEWCWSFGQHIQQTGAALSEPQRASLTLARDYLTALWRYPSSDCWEENEDLLHPHTLGAVYAGLMAIHTLLNDAPARQAAEAVRAYVLEHGVRDGRLIKSIGNPVVDANLLFLVAPFRLLPPEDSRARATVAAVQAELTSPEGGVHRYKADTYYGGGEWVLLSATLGWAACELGDLALAQRQLSWAARQASADLELPEQVFHTRLAPEYYPQWVERWGAPATPLLWSHAQYIILWERLKQLDALPEELNA